MEPQEIIGRQRMLPLQWAAVAVAALLNALNGFALLALSIASPGIAGDWKIAAMRLAGATSAALIGMTIGALALAQAADIVGRRIATLAALATMMVGMLLSAHADSVLALAVSRGLTGLGVGVMLAVTNAIPAEFSNNRMRTLAIAIMLTGYGLGVTAAGALGPILLATEGWRSIFTAGGVVALALIPAAWLLLPETIDFVAMRGRDGALARANRLLRRIGHSEAETLPADRPDHRLPLVSLFTPASVRRSLTLALAYALHVATLGYVLGTLPGLIVGAGFTAAQAHSASTFGNVVAIAVGLGVGILSFRIRIRSLLLAAMLGGGATVALFGILPHNLTVLTLGLVVAISLVEGAMVGLYTLIAQSFPPLLRVTATGLAIGCGRGGSMMGPAVAGMLARGGASPAAVTGVLALGTLLGALMIWTLPPAREV